MARTAMTGILAGNGAAMVHLLVFHHPTPQQPPAQLAELVEPAVGEDGRIQNWHLSMRSLLASQDVDVHDAWSTFNSWRRSFVVDRVIGDVATVAMFMNWAEGVRDITALHPLKIGNARLSTQAAARMAWQSREVATACRERAEMGLGISRPRQAGLVRGFALKDAPVLVLGEGGTAVSAVPTGLEVTAPDAKSALVRGWVVDADGVTAFTDDGPVPLAATVAGRLLARIAPGVANAAVGPAPLVSVFSGLLDAIQDAADVAAADLIPLWIRTGKIGSARHVVR